MTNTHRHNPIVALELAYQRRHKPSRRLYAWLYLLPTALVVVGTALHLRLVMQASTGTTSIAFRYIGEFLFFIVLFTHFGVILRTLYLSAGAVTRDKMAAQNWETLLLTGVSGYHYVFGKWWAVVSTLWREYLLLAGLRIIAVAWVTMRTQFARPPLPELSETLWAIFVLTTMTFANLLFTVACGIMASMQARRGSVVLAWVVRTGFCVLAAFAPYLLRYVYWNVDLGAIFDFFRFSGTILSNGTLLFIRMRVYPYDFPSSTLGIAANIFLPLAVYLILTGLSLWLARWRVMRSGAL